MIHITFVNYQEFEIDNKILNISKLIFVDVFISEDNFADPEVELCFEIVFLVLMFS